jgi:selenocysteine lyase/cysteine desulfurase
MATCYCPYCDVEIGGQSFAKPVNEALRKNINFRGSAYAPSIWTTYLIPCCPKSEAIIDAVNRTHSPSSQHKAGEEAAGLLEYAQKVANLIHAHSPKDRVYFGGTESINHAIKGVIMANVDKGDHIVTSNIEQTRSSEA